MASRPPPDFSAFIAGLGGGGGGGCDPLIQLCPAGGGEPTHYERPATGAVSLILASHSTPPARLVPQRRCGVWCAVGWADLAGAVLGAFAGGFAGAVIGGAVESAATALALSM